MAGAAWGVGVCGGVEGLVRALAPEDTRAVGAFLRLLEEGRSLFITAWERLGAEPRGGGLPSSSASGAPDCLRGAGGLTLAVLFFPSWSILPGLLGPQCPPRSTAWGLAPSCTLLGMVLLERGCDPQRSLAFGWEALCPPLPLHSTSPNPPTPCPWISTLAHSHLLASSTPVRPLPPLPTPPILWLPPARPGGRDLDLPPWASVVEASLEFGSPPPPPTNAQFPRLHLAGSQTMRKRVRGSHSWGIPPSQPHSLNLYVWLSFSLGILAPGTVCLTFVLVLSL